MILEKETFEDLGRTSKEAKQKDKITCQCDFCGKVFKRMKHNLQRSRQHTDVDACNIDPKCVVKKRIETTKKLFGVENVFQNEEIKKKIVKKNISLYGVSNPTQNKEIKAKQEATCKKNYGVKNPFQSEEIKKLIKESLQKKYGVSNSFQRTEIQDKQRKTLKERYGVEHALQSPELRQKAMDTCVSNYGTFPANGVYGKAQKDIQDWLNSFGFNFKSNRTLVLGKEIDIYDPNKGLAIEYCGLHWHHEHSLDPKNRKYHLHKYQECLKQNVHLLTIFSDEWDNRKKQCMSHIKSLLGLHTNKIHGRKCEVKSIDKKVGRYFFDEHHIQGRNHLGLVFFGLYFQEELVGAMSLGRHNRQFNDLVLDRLCFKEDVQVVGGASKLFSRCVKWAHENEFSKIMSFSDNRWSLGNVYNAMNFQLEKDCAPDYSYVDIKKPNKRISKQSQKKSNTGCPPHITEHEWSCQHGLSRIWDCGKKRWVFDVLA